MEEIYPPESFGASNRFSLKKYFEEFREAFPTPAQLDSEVYETDYLLAIKELMDLDLSFNDIIHLSKSCSVDQLTCEGENTKNYPIELPENLNSNSKLPFPFVTTDDNSFAVSKQVEEWKKRKEATPWMGRRSYYQRLEFPLPPTPPDLKPGSDFIISILMYRPIAFQFYNAKNTSEKLRFSHEIVALGQNTLDQLRDTILCSLDIGLSKEFETTEGDLKPLADARTIYPSGFLFIDDVFYNDFRDPKAINYSIPVMKWAKEKKIKDLRSKTMQGVTIDSLTPRLGYPYLYMHQGDCEHLFVFADAKLLDSSDCLHSRCYPHVLKLNRNSNKMCLMCSVSFAKWICVGSDRLPQHKVFLCTDCCKAYNYVDGKKIGNFKLYPYYEKHVM